jgi:hypothetical protein
MPIGEEPRGVFLGRRYSLSGGSSLLDLNDLNLKPNLHVVSDEHTTGLEGLIPGKVKITAIDRG